MIQPERPRNDPLLPPAQPRTVPLSELPANTPALIAEILPNPQITRLMEIGLYPDARVTVLQPGERVILSVNNARLAIRRETLSFVLVRIIGSFT